MIFSGYTPSFNCFFGDSICAFIGNPIPKTRIENNKKKINNKLCYVISKQGLKLHDILHKIKDFAIDSDYLIPKYCKENKCYCAEIFKKK